MREIIPVGKDITAMSVAGDWLIFANYKNGLELYNLIDEVGGPATTQNGRGDISGLTNDGEMLTALFWENEGEFWSRNSIVQIKLEELIREGKINSKVGMSPEIELPTNVRSVVKDESGNIYIGASRGVAKLAKGATLIGTDAINGFILAMVYDPVNKRLFCSDWSKEGSKNKVVVLNLRDGTHGQIQEDLAGYTVYSLAYKDDNLFMGVCGNQKIPRGVLVRYDLKEDKVKSRLAIEGKVFPSSLAFYREDLLIAGNAPSEGQGGITNLGNPFDLENKL